MTRMDCLSCKCCHLCNLDRSLEVWFQSIRECFRCWYGLSVGFERCVARLNLLLQREKTVNSIDLRMRWKEPWDHVAEQDSPRDITHIHRSDTEWFSISMTEWASRTIMILGIRHGPKQRSMASLSWTNIYPICSINSPSPWSFNESLILRECLWMNSHEICQTTVTAM